MVSVSLFASFLPHSGHVAFAKKSSVGKGEPPFSRILASSGSFMGRSDLGTGTAPQSGQ
jgi:hypothetical protein